MRLRRTPTRHPSGRLATALHRCRATMRGVRQTLRNAHRRCGGRFGSAAVKMTPPGSNGATPGPSAPGDHIDDDDRDDRADSGNHDRADVQRTIDRLGVEEDAGQEATNDGAHDPENDVTDDSETLVTLDKEAREVAGDRAEDQPGNDAHKSSSIPPRDLHPPAGCLPSLKSRNGPTVGQQPHPDDYAAVTGRINRLAGPDLSH